MDIFFIEDNSIKEGEIVGKYLRAGEYSEKITFQIKSKENYSKNYIDIPEDLVFQTKGEAETKLSLIQSEKEAENKRKRLEEIENAIELLNREFKPKKIEFDIKNFKETKQ